MTPQFDAAAYLYPWDVVGDPAAPELIAGLGLDHVSLAAAYHAARALTPRHPEHRVVVAEHSAVYFPPDDRLWAGSSLRPAAQTWLAGTDPFGDAAASLASAGVPAHAWVVVSHRDAPPGTDPDTTVVNAYGDRYGWALCPSNPGVRDYARRLAADVAARDDVVGVEFESCGWYGFDHLHAHDKVAGVSLNHAEQFLFSLCFCASCRVEYHHTGIDSAMLSTAVRAALDARFLGGPRPLDPAASEQQAIESALGSDLAGAVLEMRTRVADRFRLDVVEAVRARRAQRDFPIVFHANPVPHRSTASTGLDPAWVPVSVDGVVVNCWSAPEDAAKTVSLTADTAREELRVLAGLSGVGGWGATPEGSLAVLEAVRSAGASGIRIYHAGLAGPGDLDLIRTLATEAHLGH
jgi:hypothetical protein